MTQDPKRIRDLRKANLPFIDQKIGDQCFLASLYFIFTTSKSKLAEERPRGVGMKDPDRTLLWVSSVLPSKYVFHYHYTELYDESVPPRWHPSHTDHFPWTDTHSDPTVFWHKGNAYNSPNISLGERMKWLFRGWFLMLSSLSNCVK